MYRKWNASGIQTQFSTQLWIGGPWVCACSDCSHPLEVMPAREGSKIVCVSESTIGFVDTYVVENDTRERREIDKIGWGETFSFKTIPHHIRRGCFFLLNRSACYCYDFHASTELQCFAFCACVCVLNEWSFQQENKRTHFYCSSNVLFIIPEIVLNRIDIAFEFIFSSLYVARFCGVFRHDGAIFAEVGRLHFDTGNGVAAVGTPFEPTAVQFYGCLATKQFWRPPPLCDSRW